MKNPARLILGGGSLLFLLLLGLVCWNTNIPWVGKWIIFVGLGGIPVFILLASIYSPSQRVPSYQQLGLPEPSEFQKVSSSFASGAASWEIPQRLSSWIQSNQKFCSLTALGIRIFSILPCPSQESPMIKFSTFGITRPMSEESTAEGSKSRLAWAMQRS